MSNILHISYLINARNEIVSVNDAWSEFALANDAPELVAGKVLNRNLWDFISDETAREFYKKLVDETRVGRSFNFNFRCDSPDLRRFFEMEITSRENGNIQFDTHLLNIEKRVYQSVFQNDARRDDSVIMVCSWCKKIETGDGNWHEIEAVISTLKLFESENIPQMSHGMCVSCFQLISEKYRDIFDGKTGIK